MKPNRFDAVIFDIDNVLIDTRASYLDAIRWTVQIYLTHGNVPLFQPDEKPGHLLLSPKDVSDFKLLGGFNDDWDCCYGILIYLLTLNVPRKRLTDLKKMMNFTAFAKKASARPLGVNGIVKMLGRPANVMIEKISRIFQEIYLGRDLFQKREGRRAFYWKKRGLINKEKPLFRKSTLQKLKESGVLLGIATGRPRFEALYALDLFEIRHFFTAITTMDEVKKAEREMKQSLRKPNPYSLIQTAKALGEKKKFLYIGDLPDDILATKQAADTISIKSVAFPWFCADSANALAEIKKINPDYILEKASELSRIVQG